MPLISEACTGLLADLYANAAACGVVLPAVSFVGHGNPAIDCELLSVFGEFNTPVPRDFASRGAPCVITTDWNVSVEFWLETCLPEYVITGTSQALTPETRARMEADAIEALDIVEYIHKRSIHFLAIEDGIECSRSVIGTTRPVRPRGGMIGWTSTFTIREVML